MMSSASGLVPTYFVNSVTTKLLECVTTSMLGRRDNGSKKSKSRCRRMYHHASSSSTKRRQTTLPSPASPSSVPCSSSTTSKRVCQSREDGRLNKVKRRFLLGLVTHYTSTRPLTTTSTHKLSASKGDKKSRIHSLLSLKPVLFDPTRAPRNPIVLAHGLYGFSVLGPSAFPRFQVHYWGELLDILRNRIGAKVIIGSVPGTGAIQDRSRALHDMLKRHESLKGGGQDVNIVGHSMGGLDARHLICHVKPREYRPVSLTTICTPHKGSPFMAWCQANIGVGSAYRDFGKSEWSDKVSDVQSMIAPSSMPFSLKEPLFTRKRRLEASQEQSAISSYLLNVLDSPAYSNLHPSFLNDHFNPTTPNVDGVKYFSVASRVSKLGFWHPLWFSKTILDAHESRAGTRGLSGNDGLVPVESAQWGEYLGLVENADHWAMRGGTTFFQGDSHGGGWRWQDVNALLGKTWRDSLARMDATTRHHRRACVDPAFPLDEVWSTPTGRRRDDDDDGDDDDNDEDATSASTGDKFDLGELYGALCRNLYEHGL